MFEATLQTPSASAYSPREVGTRPAELVGDRTPLGVDAVPAGDVQTANLLKTKLKKGTKKKNL